MHYEHSSRKTLLFLCRTTVDQNVSSLCKVTRNLKVQLPITKFIFCYSSTAGIFIFSNDKDDYTAPQVHFSIICNTRWKAHSQCSETDRCKHAAWRLWQPAIPQLPLEKLTAEKRTRTTPKGLGCLADRLRKSSATVIFRFPLKF